jgi:hypothetical protein
MKIEVTRHGRRTSKHSDFVNVVELSVAFAVKGSPQIGYEDLCALEEAHFLALECAFIAKAGELFGEQVDETGC